MSLRISQLAVVLCRLICILFLLHNVSPTIKYGGGNETDLLALLEIKAQITHDPMDHVTGSWNDSVHFCQWQGVSCGRRHHQRVTVLDLQSLNLVASISPSIGNLSFLRFINLSNNIIQGEVPAEIGQLFRLQILNLMNNLLEGQIPPSISGCSNLRILALGKNKLTGKIPLELGSSLSKLVRLDLDSNKLTGMIPPSFGNLSFLEFLLADSNLLEGSIPHSLGQLKSLSDLGLSWNDLSGTVPPSIYNLSSLSVLSMINQLQGSLPANLGLTLPNLRRFSIGGNQFSGFIPVSLSNASNLQTLQIVANGFSQGVPLIFGNMQNLSRLIMMGSNDYLGNGKDGDLNFISSLTNCSKLRTLALISNNFGGSLPVSIANLSIQLQFLSVARNKISGNIPTGIGNLVKLTSLDMHLNQFQGSIPSSIGLLHNLQELGFGKNKLSGKIPSSIGNLTLLNQLWLEENNFQGGIPSTLGNCKRLVLLHLYGNNLSGTIPRTVIGLSSLAKSLDLSQNSLTGPLPLEVGNLGNLVELNVAHNELSGEIPTSLGSCTSLERLYLGYNSFGGAIPKSLSSLKGIEVLDISHNNLSGEIPKDLGSILTLKNLNLSSNDLEGEVPIIGVFSNVSAVSISGNNKLCGGISALQLPICSTNKPKKSKTSPPLKLIVPIVFGVVGITLMSSFLILLWFKKKRARPSSVSSQMELMSISYGELLKATNGFSSTNLIGKGSFGSVYKGILDPNQTAIAVKVLNLHNRGAFKSFMTECETLRNIRHRNLVKILTACSSIDFHGDNFKALVYEFMPNGSLDNWLHPVPQGADNVLLLNEGPEKLNLLQRLNIAIDVASALDYLHHHCQIPIIHCDLKPSNILLDGKMTARVGDFGIARFLQQDNDEIHQNQTVSSVGIKGTIGYAAPEYGMGSEVSTHGDVYSYGILLLEMFTGKRPTDSMFKDGLNIHKFAAMGGLPERVTEIMDHQLVLDAQVEKLAASSDSGTQVRRLKVIECLISILGVGVSCTKDSPRERMDISVVAKELQFIKNLVIENMT